MKENKKKRKEKHIGIQTHMDHEEACLKPIKVYHAFSHGLKVK